MPKNVCDEPVFSDLYQSWSQANYRFLRFKGAVNQQAEDITQEAFLRLWKNCHTIEPQQVKGFLYRVATNLFLDQVKHQKVVLSFKEKKTKVSRPVTPEEELREQEFRTNFLQALAQLPENQRVVFLMSRTEQLTYREIAERLDLSQKAVEKRMSKALQTLREKLRSFDN